MREGMVRMRMDVVGGGAIGLLTAARLAKAGVDVTVWTRTERQRDLLNAEGVTLLGLQATTGERVKVRGAWMEQAGEEARPDGGPGMRENGGEGWHWIVLAVKQGDIDSRLLRQLRTLAAERGAIVCVQNGIGHMEKLAASLGSVPVFAAVTTEGARREGAATVRHTGEGVLWLGEQPESGCADEPLRQNAQKMLLSALQMAGFAAFLSNEIKDHVYRKLLVNAVINPLTAIFDVPNGELPQHPRRLELMRRLHAETEAVLLSAGMTARPGSWEALLDVCGRTAANISSMLADVRAGKATEIAEINGAVVGLAEKMGMAAPLNAAVAAIVAASGPTQGGGSEQRWASCGIF